MITSASTLLEALDEPAHTPALRLVVCGLASNSDLGGQLDALERSCSTTPGIRFVVLAHAPDQSLVHRAVAAGVDAVLSKNISGEVLQRSLELVMLGQQLFPTSVSQLPITPLRIQFHFRAPSSGRQPRCRRTSGTSL